MLIRDLRGCPEITAGDNAVLRELLHPDKADVKLRYSLAHAVVPVGKSSLPHRLRSSEVYYVLAGEGMMYVDEETAHVSAGQVIYIPPGSRQYIENTGATELRFLCIVDPAWRKKDEEVETAD